MNGTTETDEAADRLRKGINGLLAATTRDKLSELQGEIDQAIDEIGDRLQSLLSQATASKDPKQ